MISVPISGNLVDDGNRTISLAPPWAISTRPNSASTTTVVPPTEISPLFKSLALCNIASLGVKMVVEEAGVVAILEECSVVVAVMFMSSFGEMIIFFALLSQIKSNFVFHVESAELTGECLFM